MCLTAVGMESVFCGFETLKLYNMKKDLSWNDVKEKYLEYYRLDNFTENMATDIDFGYWLVKNCSIPVVSGSVLSELDYWKIRCKLSEAIEAENPCDPDITTEQINAYSDYNKFIERYGTDR